MSINLMDLFQGQLEGGLLDNLTDSLGGADKQQTSAAANGIVSTLMAAMSKNAATPEGASSLASALDRDHDGSIMDDVMGLLSGNATQSRASNGSGILNHILGNKQNGIIDMISNMSGLDSGSTGSLMLKLAPMLMGMLGQQKKQQGLDIGGIASLLTNNVSQKATNDNQLGLIGKFLDSDGDGSIADDVASIGMKFLGNMFR